MAVLLSIIVGVLFASGLYLMMRRSIVKLIIGLALVSHGANLLIFTSGGLTRGRPPLVPAGAETLAAGEHSDPLPPALILTAIVISFAIMAFATVLVKRAYQEIGSDDLNDLRATDR